MARAEEQESLRRALAEGTAAAVLEGYSPTQAFEQDCRAIVEGSLTFEQARQNALERAQRGEIG
jgi:hypothetical protein